MSVVLQFDLWLESSRKRAFSQSNCLHALCLDICIGIIQDMSYPVFYLTRQFIQCTYVNLTLCLTKQYTTKTKCFSWWHCESFLSLLAFLKVLFLSIRWEQAMLKISVKLPPHFCGDSRPAAYKIPQDRKMSDYFKLLANPIPLKCFFDIWYWVMEVLVPMESHLLHLLCMCDNIYSRLVDMSAIWPNVWCLQSRWCLQTKLL